ncbi:WD repeat-containing protein 54 [Chamberlinius hualienensis]
MYTKQPSIVMRSTASACNQNLAIHQFDGQLIKAAVINQSTANVLTWDIKTEAQVSQQLVFKNQTLEKKPIIQVTLCEIGDKLILVLLYSDGIQFFDEDGSELNYFNLGQYIQDEDVKGRCIVNGEGSKLAVGTDKNQILNFRFVTKSTDAVQYNTITAGHTGAVSCIAISGKYMASGGDDGRVSVYNSTSPYEKLQVFDLYRSSVTVVNIWKTWIAAAYGSGHLRLFDLKTRQLLAEVTAHAKWITGMDIAQSTGLILTVSEDTFIRVWEVTPSEEGVMAHKFSQPVTDTCLCGGRFIDSEGKQFAVTGFESEEMFCFSSK